MRTRYPEYEGSVTAVCKCCGKEFNHPSCHTTQKYCSLRCRENVYRSQTGFTIGCDRDGNTGAVSELRVCAAMLLAGYEIHRCVSAHGHFDLTAWKDGKVIGVQVKTGRINALTGTHKHVTQKKNDGYWAYYFPDDDTILLLNEQGDRVDLTPNRRTRSRKGELLYDIIT